MHHSISGLVVDQSLTTLWMGDLDSWMDDVFIKNVWFQYGEPVAIKQIKDQKTGSTASYCFVDFTHHEAAGAYLNSVNGSLIPGTSRIFKLNWASGNVMNPLQEVKQKEYPVFVGDFGPEVTDYMLLQPFQQKFKTICHCKVVIDPMSGKSRCYGFVRFIDEEDSKRAIFEMNGVYIGQRSILVSTAHPRPHMIGDHSISSGAMPLVVDALPKEVLARPKPPPPKAVAFPLPPPMNPLQALQMMNSGGGVKRSTVNFKNINVYGAQYPYHYDVFVEDLKVPVDGKLLNSDYCLQKEELLFRSTNELLRK